MPFCQVQEAKRIIGFMRMLINNDGGTVLAALLEIPIIISIITLSP